jgi:hypothetical protein
MLTECDRAQLGPCLAKIRAAKAALPEAERAADQAKQHLSDFRRGTTLSQRWLNLHSPIRLAYRELRKVGRDAAASFAQGRKQIKTLSGHLYKLIGPMMPRLDSKYEARALVIESCTRAVRECEARRKAIDALVHTIRDAARNGRDEKARKEAEAARLRYPGELVRARKAAAAVKQSVELVGDAVTRAGVRASGLRWNAASLDRLPSTAEGIAARRLMVREQWKVQRTLKYLPRLRKELAGLQRRTAQAQRAAHIQARDRLIKKSAP